MTNALPKNSICFKLTGRQALFTDPITRVGGEKCSYHVPTYEALKGVCKSIYWKPTLIWVVDKVRVLKPIRTHAKGTKPLKWGGGNDLSIYTFLRDVEYQVQAHFVWNPHRPELKQDRVDGKHYNIAKRMLEKGGRQDVFLGTRDCQGYVEPCEFGEGGGAFDTLDELGFGMMFHGFDYPDETGVNQLQSRFWRAAMHDGVINFCLPEECEHRQLIRNMEAKQFELDKNIALADEEVFEQ